MDFADGSQYEFHGISEDETLLWSLLEDPGCYYNTKIVGRGGITATKTRGPS